MSATIVVQMSKLRYDYVQQVPRSAITLVPLVPVNNSCHEISVNAFGTRFKAVIMTIVQAQKAKTAIIFSIVSSYNILSVRVRMSWHECLSHTPSVYTRGSRSGLWCELHIGD